MGKPDHDRRRDDSLAGSDAEAAIAAGAQFIVTPTLQLDTIELCHVRQTPIICAP